MFIVYIYNVTEESWEAQRRRSSPSGPVSLLWLFYMNKPSDEGQHEGCEWTQICLISSHYQQVRKYSSFSRGTINLWTQSQMANIHCAFQTAQKLKLQATKSVICRCQCLSHTPTRKLRMCDVVVCQKSVKIQPVLACLITAISVSHSSFDQSLTLHTV